MKTDVPFIGKNYKVISGAYIGFIGKCISYDLESSLPIILQDDNWNGRAVKIEEVEIIDDGNFDTNLLQHN